MPRHPESTSEATRAPGAPARDPSRAVAERLQHSIGTHKYGLWFERQTQFATRDGTLEVAARSKLVADWIGRHYGPALNEVAGEVLGNGATVTVRLRPDLFDARHDPTDSAPERLDSRPGTREPARRGSSQHRRPAERGIGDIPTRRFDDTVVGGSNRVAFESARAVAEDREQSMRMLFLHGRCGVGKSHLLQAIAHRRHELAPTAHIRYLTGEQFTNEYIAAVREGGLEGFRRRIRRQHLLVIDDIHFLASKTATQTEFQHTVDEIALAGGTVVLASDGHPRQMQKVGAGLVSRFMAGMVVRIDEPDHAMRGQLAQRFAAARGMRLSDGAISLIADRVTGSVREIEGAVSAIAAMRLVTGRGAAEPISASHVTEALGAGLPSLRGRPARIGEIIDACCAATGVSREDLMSASRHRRVVAARGLIAHLAREMTTMSFPEIALALGRPTHSTVHAAAARFRAALESGATVPCADGDRPAADVADQARRDVGRVHS
jgi:chromosomal replication initiator protein